MTWLKTSDDFGDQCAGLSDAAFRTHVEGLLWVMRRETGGQLDRRDVRRFAETANPDKAVQELVDHGFWTATGSGYQIQHHMEHQPDPETLAARRANDAERQARRRRKAAGLDTTSQRESRRDTPRDVTRDDPRDPGRDGSGLDGTGTPTPQRQKTQTLAAIAGGHA